ncbi:MAG: Fatty acid metabolism regulator protein [Smithella sp. PtaU1.Bin162]|nr:MAG: Fatty acid metabolism regulator protein [Smithella sp. PtaU1.Bin162]
MSPLKKFKNKPLKNKSVLSNVKNEDLIDRRRKQIIQGAVKVFSEKGFHKTTVREIADASGLTMGTMYNYVRTKEDILYICYQHMTDILSEGLRKAVEGLDDTKEELRIILKRNLDLIYEYQDTIMFLYQESGAYDQDAIHAVLSREMKYVESFEDILRRRFKGQKINEFRLKLAADLLAYTPVILVLRRWSLTRRFDSMEEVKEGIVGFLEKEIELIVE